MGKLRDPNARILFRLAVRILRKKVGTGTSNRFAISVHVNFPCSQTARELVVLLRVGAGGDSQVKGFEVSLLSVSKWVTISMFPRTPT